MVLIPPSAKRGKEEMPTVEASLIGILRVRFLPAPLARNLTKRAGDNG